MPAESVNPLQVFEASPMPGWIVAVRKPMRGEQITAGGILLPPKQEQAQPSCMARVIKVGEGVDNIKPGDMVIINPFPMKGAQIALRMNKEVQAIIPKEEVYATYRMRDATEEDIKAWEKADKMEVETRKRLEEMQKKHQSRILQPDKRVVLP